MQYKKSAQQLRHVSVSIYIVRIMRKFLLNMSLLGLLIATALFSRCVADDEFEDQTALQNELETIFPEDSLYDQCPTEDVSFPYGSCMLEQECDLIGGVVSGSCAEGLGSCCIVKISCGDSTSFNNSYFVNPGEGDVGKCSLAVHRMQDDVCQIRLDFLELHLSQPDWNGHCKDDFLIVTGETATFVPPILCGHNDGQHMYVEVEPDGGALEIVIDSVLPSSSRSWRIQATQIGCDSRYLAPSGCLQYYTESVANVKSFNFLPESSDSKGTATIQIANHNYGVCVKKMPGYCGIIWERDYTTDLSFTVTGSVSALMPSLLGTPAACSVGNDCQKDYVIIPGGVSEFFHPEQSDRFCGLGFPDSVTSTASPFVLYVRTDGGEEEDSENRGFSLNYRQTADC